MNPFIAVPTRSLCARLGISRVFAEETLDAIRHENRHDRDVQADWGANLQLLHVLLEFSRAFVYRRSLVTVASGLAVKSEGRLDDVASMPWRWPGLDHIVSAESRLAVAIHDLATTPLNAVYLAATTIDELAGHLRIWQRSLQERIGGEIVDDHLEMIGQPDEASAREILNEAIDALSQYLARESELDSRLICRMSRRVYLVTLWTSLIHPVLLDQNRGCILELCENALSRVEKCGDRERIARRIERLRDLTIDGLKERVANV
jgi:hypothetical protein